MCGVWEGDRMASNRRGTVDAGRPGRGRAAALGDVSRRARLPACETSGACTAFLCARQAGGVRPKTLIWYGTILGAYGRAHRWLPSEPEAVESFLAGLGEVSDETRYGYWRGLRTFYRWVSARLGLPDATAAVARPRRRRKLPGSLSVSEVRRVMASAMSGRDKALLTLLLDTGMRIGEAHSLTWERVLDEVVVVDGKTGPREVPISPWTRWVLMGVALPWRSSRRDRRPVTVNGLARAVRRCLRRAGVAAGGPHLLRHTFARLYLRAGGDAFSLQRILGHRELTTTRIYVELELGDLVERHRRWSPIVRLLEEAAGASS